MRIVFSGSIGRLPLGGHAWSQLQYLVGLQQLGHDVYYLEDCGEGSWVYDWEAEEITTDLSYPGAFLQDCLAPFDLGDRWIYRAGSGSLGMTVEAFGDASADADLLLIWAVPPECWRAEYDLPRRRAFIDADPGFTQIRLLHGDRNLANTIDRSERLFTLGQRLGAEDCLIPAAGRTWFKTVAPVSLADWNVDESSKAAHFTSILQWRGFHDVVHEGVVYGQKDREFPKFVDLPRRTRQTFQLALTGAAPEQFSSAGWDVVPGWMPSRTPWSYRTFIQNSRAEFGVAKHGYVHMRGGWFSDRSVCYLASGRPVLLEDTGLEEWLPVGSGILTFRTLEEAVCGVEAINADYERHAAQARRLAEEFFAVDRVLPQLLDAALN